MFGKQYKNKSLFREALSENGIGSAKRLMGLLIIVVCLCCIVYLTIKEGGTSVVKDLIDTALLVACALLGLSSITSIWKKAPTQCNENNECENEENINEKEN